jgi:hypothetical protein
MESKKVSKYEQAAIDFAKKHGVEMTAEYRGHYKRGDFDFATAVYSITLSRKDKKPYTFDFSTSVNDSYCYHTGFSGPRKGGIPSGYKLESVNDQVLKNGQCYCKQFTVIKRKIAPTMYDILACIQKNDPGTLHDFCGDMGYDEDSRKAEKIYFDCQNEFSAVRSLFSDCMEELQEIN